MALKREHITCALIILQLRLALYTLSNTLTTYTNADDAAAGA